MITFVEADLYWVCDQVGIGKDTVLRRVLQRRLCEAERYAVIAKECGISETCARQHVHQGRKRILEHQWKYKLGREVHDQLETLRMLTEDMEQVTEAAQELLSVVDEARTMQAAARGPQDGDREAPLAQKSPMVGLCDWVKVNARMRRGKIA